MTRSDARRHRLRLASRLALTTALGTLVLGYGRRAYAGSCNPVGSVILCSGPADPATDTTQFLYGPLVSVQTSPGFGLDTFLTSFAGVSVEGTGGLSFDGSAPGLSIRANGTALRAYNFGGGAILVDTRGGALTAGDFNNPYSTQSGIRASNNVDGTGITIRTGDINATELGILARNFGAGDVVIDTTGGKIFARGTTIASGIYVLQAGTANAVSVASGDVRGNRHGIYVNSDSAAPVTIDSRSGQALGVADTGIFVRGRDLAIRSADSSGGIEGIFAENKAGNLLIDSTAGAVSGGRESGINVFNYGTDAAVTTADVSGVTFGIDLFSRATGSVTVDTTRGVVSSRTASGIRVQNFGTDVTVTTGGVNGGTNGIRIINSGTGALTLNSTAGAVTGPLDGISVRNSGSSMALTTGAVSGGRSGIFAVNQSGPVMIDSTAGAVSGGALHGIYVQNTGSSVSIWSGDVTGGADGIRILSTGTAPVSVDTRSGKVTGTSDTGIAIDASSVSLRTADVEGGDRGISVVNRGGAATIDTTAGVVTGMVRATNYGTSLVVNAGRTSGISALNYGSGDLVVTASSGAVPDGEVPASIFATDTGKDARLLLAGRFAVVDLIHMGTGDASIDTHAAVIDSRDNQRAVTLVTSNGDARIVTGDVRFATLTGIRAAAVSLENTGPGLSEIDTRSGSVATYAMAGPDEINTASGISALSQNGLIIRTGRVSAGYTAISADNALSGNLTIDTMGGAVRSEIGTAISAYARGESGELHISAADLSGWITAISATQKGPGGIVIEDRAGRVDGDILAENSGTGSVAIDTRGASVTSRNYGIFATNAGASLTIRTSDVSTASDAVKGINTGTGDFVIDTSQGAVRSAYDRAIWGYNSGRSMSVYAGDAAGSKTGIVALNKGSGDLTITGSGTVSGSETSIYATNFGGDVLINRSGELHGMVSVYHDGRGAARLDLRQAPVTAHNNGIQVTSTGGEIDLESAAVVSDLPDPRSAAVLAVQRGDGAIRIDTRAGQLTSTSGVGLYALSEGAGDITIQSAGISAAGQGLLAVNKGGGSLVIDSTGGMVESAASDGIYALNEAGGADMRIASGDVTGADRAIFASNKGTGSLTIDSSAGTLFAGYYGISAEGAAGSGGIAVTAGDILSNYAAILVEQQGAGAVSIDSRPGLLWSRDGHGISVAATGGGGISILSGAIDAGQPGIRAENAGGGGIAIDSTAGPIFSARESGIIAVSDAASTDIGIRAGAVTAAASAVAIAADNRGTGRTRIEVAEGALVTGGTGAISVSHSGSGRFEIANAGELRRLSGDPAAVVIDAKAVGAAGGVSLTNTGRITGTVSLTGKDDSVVNDGTWNMAGGTSDFGAGRDVFANRSNLTFVAAADGARAETTALVNLETFSNSGTVTMADGATGDTLVTSGDFDGTGGIIRLDMAGDGTSADLLRITGNVTGGPSRLAINYLGPAGGIGTIGVPLVQVGGTTKDGDFRIANPVWDGVVYRLVLGAGNSWSATAAFSLAETFAALDRDAGVAERLLDGQQAGLVNAMAQDCTRFGPGGACVSLAGRSTTLSEDQGASDALVLTAALQPRETSWRVGAFLDQRVAGELPDGFSFERMGPTLGGFAGYGAADGRGPRLRLSGAWSTAQLGVERPDLLGLIEGGTAQATFSGWGLGGEVGYGFGLAASTAVTPFAGLRRVVSTRGAYAEQDGDAAYPLSAEAMSMAQTTVSAGATLHAGRADALSLEAGFGVEHDVAVALDSFDGSFRDIGSFAVDPGSAWRRTRLFGGAGLDYTLDDGVGLSLTAAARQLPLDGAVDVTATAGVRASF